MAQTLSSMSLFWRVMHYPSPFHFLPSTSHKVAATYEQHKLALARTHASERQHNPISFNILAASQHSPAALSPPAPWGHRSWISLPHPQPPASPPPPPPERIKCTRLTSEWNFCCHAQQSQETVPPPQSVFPPPPPLKLLLPTRERCKKRGRGEEEGLREGRAEECRGMSVGGGEGIKRRWAEERYREVVWVAKGVLIRPLVWSDHVHALVHTQTQLQSYCYPLFL